MGGVGSGGRAVAVVVVVCPAQGSWRSAPEPMSVIGGELFADFIDLFDICAFFKVCVSDLAEA